MCLKKISSIGKKSQNIRPAWFDFLFEMETVIMPGGLSVAGGYGKPG